MRQSAATRAAIIRQLKALIVECEADTILGFSAVLPSGSHTARFAIEIDSADAAARLRAALADPDPEVTGPNGPDIDVAIVNLPRTLTPVPMPVPDIADDEDAGDAEWNEPTPTTAG